MLSASQVIIGRSSVFEVLNAPLKSGCDKNNESIFHLKGVWCTFSFLFYFG